MNSENLDILQSCSNNWTELAHCAALKYSALVQNYYSTINDVIENQSAVSYDFITSYGIVKSVDLAECISNGNLLVNVTNENDEVIQVDASLITKEIYSNVESAQITICGLEAISTYYGDTAADVITIYDSLVSDTLNTVSNKSFKQWVKGIISNVGTDIGTKINALINAFRFKNDTYIDFSSLNNYYGDYTSSNAAMAAFGMVHINWTAVALAAPYALYKMGEVFINVYRGIANKMEAGFNRFVSWVKNIFVSSNFITTNDSYSELALDSGSYKGSFPIQLDNSDHHISSDTVYKIKIAGMILYITNIIPIQNADQEYKSYSMCDVYACPVANDYILNHNYSSLNANLKILTSLFDGSQFDTSYPSSELYDFSSNSGTALLCSRIRTCHHWFYTFINGYGTNSATPCEISPTGTAAWGNFFKGYDSRNDTEINGDWISTNVVINSGLDASVYFSGILKCNYTVNWDYDDAPVFSDTFSYGLSKFISETLNHTYFDYSFVYPYEEVTSLHKGLFHIQSEAELAGKFWNILKTTGKVILTVAAIVATVAITKKISAAGLKAAATADLYYFSDNFTGTTAQWNQYIKLARKADLIQNLIGTVGASLTSIGQTIYGKIQSAFNAVTSIISNKVSDVSAVDPQSSGDNLLIYIAQLIKS